MRHLPHWLIIILLIGSISACTRIGDPITGEMQPAPDIGEVDGSGDGEGTDALCQDGILDGDETDIDCGGTCPTKCSEGQMCTMDSDCESGHCEVGACVEPIPPPAYQGRTFGFVSDRDGSDNLYFMGTESMASALRKLTDNTAAKIDWPPAEGEWPDQQGVAYARPDFSRDGTKLVFTSFAYIFPPVPLPGLLYSDFDADVGGLAAFGDAYKLEGETSAYFSFSPYFVAGDNKVAVIRYRKDAGDGKWYYWAEIADPFGTAAPEPLLDESLNELDKLIWNSSQNPDAGSATYVYSRQASQDNKYFHIYASDGQGDNELQLVPDPDIIVIAGDLKEPALSPNGTLLAYTAKSYLEGDKFDIGICEIKYNGPGDVECTNRKLLTGVAGDEGNNHNPCWLGNDSVIFDSDRDGDKNIYWIPDINAGDLTPVKLTEDLGDDHSPACFPDLTVAQ